MGFMKLTSNTRNTRMIFGIVVVGVAIVLAGLLLVLFPRNNRYDVSELPEPPLKQLAVKHNVMLGNHAILNRIGEPEYAGILTSQFDFVLADNTPNWYFTDGGLRPGPEQYNFAEMDRVMAFAEQHAMPVQAHHYVWGEEKWLPEWLTKGNYSEEQVMNFMKEHIMTVGRKYSGRIAEWTVVNEPFTRNQHIFGLKDWWADNTGGTINYIDQAFRWAREADPNSKLILNDFYNESINDVSDWMFEYVRGAKDRGVPIDGVGFQMHIDGTHPPMKDEVKSNMKRFVDLGVKVYVTEFDINMGDLKASKASKDEVAGSVYYEMMRACIETEGCDSFAYLGITDKETWYNYMGIKDPRPLMFDELYRPKPAFWATRTALEQD